MYLLNDKYDSFNLWHGLEDVTHAFEAFALKGWGAEAQVRLLCATATSGTSAFAIYLGSMGDPGVVAAAKWL